MCCSLVKIRPHCVTLADLGLTTTTC
jgi:hypothetical protein